MRDFSPGKVFDAIYRPGAIAIVGASQDPDRMGGRVLRQIMDFGFPGEIYPVHPSASEIGGLRCYRSVRDIPGRVDRAYIITPTAIIPQIVDDCVAKGVTVAQILSGGFGELGPTGRALEERVLATARAGGLRLIGPNCLGTYSPAGGLTLAFHSAREPGRIAVVSQSGGLSLDIVQRGALLGIRYSKVISVGNCIDLDHPDFLEDLLHDEGTETIAFYMESVRDGRRFFELLRETTRRKPVVIVKGGRTAAGSSSVASHTGTLAGSHEVWQAALRQAGAVCLRSLEELMAALTGFQFASAYASAPGGVALFGNGGGVTVLASDACEELGLHLVRPSAETRQRLQALDIPGGVEAGNPLDLSVDRLVAREGALFGEVVQAFCDDALTGAVVFHFNMTAFSYRDPLAVFDRLLTHLAQVRPQGKVLTCVLRSSGRLETETLRAELVRRLHAMGIGVFRTVEEALLALAVVRRARSHQGAGASA